MNKLMLSWLVAVGATWVGMAAGAAPKWVKEANKPEVRYRMIAQNVWKEMSQSHMWRQAPNDMISQRAWTNLLDSCDSVHMVFTAADIEEFEKSSKQLDNMFRKGDFTFAVNLRARFRERLQERVAFATNLLAQGKFEFTKNESYACARETSPWPKAGAERDALWSARVKCEVLDELIGNEKGGLTNAVRAVKKSYLDMLVAERKRKPTAEYGNFVSAVVSAYDAHTLYLTNAQFDMFQSQMDLSLCGIGAEWSLKDGVSKIKRVIPGGPLAKDGRVHAGDVILGVAPKGDGKIVKIAGKNEGEITPMFRGKKGSKITLEIKHPNGEVKQYTLKRGDVPMDDEAASSKVVEIEIAGAKRKVGYLRLPSFYSSIPAAGKSKRSCAEDLRAELEKLRKAEVCGVLFDLRGNNGGSLDDAVKVIGLFVRSGAAVRMHGPGGDTTLLVPVDGVVCEVPVLVLTTRGSASAGELVPGTLQDLGRAVIAGDTRTFGKGSAQTVRQIAGGKRNGALVVTDGRFYRVTGASTQFKGVESDILLPSCCDEELFKGERGLRYPLPWDEIEACEFSPSWDLNRHIPELRRLASERQAKSAAWQQHLQLVKDSEERADRKTIPLELKARKTQLDRDEAVDNELERLNDHGFDPTRRNEDIVLDEGLNMLADLVRLNGGNKLPAAKPVKSDTTGLLGGLDDD